MEQGLIYIAAALIALLSIAGLIHAFTTRKDETVLLVTHEHVDKEPSLT